MNIDRSTIATLISEKLTSDRDSLTAQYHGHRLPYFVIDRLLPDDLAVAISRAFPDTAQMVLKKSLRELKYVTAQMNRCESLQQRWKPRALAGGAIRRADYHPE